MLECAGPANLAATAQESEGTGRTESAKLEGGAARVGQVGRALLCPSGGACRRVNSTSSGQGLITHLSLRCYYCRYGGTARRRARWGQTLVGTQLTSWTLSGCRREERIDGIFDVLGQVKLWYAWTKSWALAHWPEAAEAEGKHHKADQDSTA